MIPLKKVVQTNEHLFVNYLVKTFGKLPDDPFYEDIDPYLRVWLYESWLYDQKLEVEKLRNLAIFLGSFFNPQAAEKMIKKSNPDFVATDVDETSKQIRKRILEEEKTKGRKKRKKRKVLK